MNLLNVSHPKHFVILYIDVIGSKLDVWATPLQ
jgi:hypothetical protein